MASDFSFDLSQCKDGVFQFSCDELKSGVNKLKTLLSHSKKNKIMVYSQNHANNTNNCMLSQILTIGLSLATNSYPVFNQNCSYIDIPEHNRNDLHTFAPEESVEYGVYDNCFSNKSLSKNLALYNALEDSEYSYLPSHIVFHPLLESLIKDLGPAGLYILVHYSLNIPFNFREDYSQNPVLVISSIFNVSTSKIPNVKDARCLLSTVVDVKIKKPRNSCSGEDVYNELKEVSSYNSILYNIGDPTGWIASVLTGRVSYLQDSVGHGIIKGTKYYSGWANSVYSSVFRSYRDLNLIFQLCPDQTIENTLFKDIL